MYALKWEAKTDADMYKAFGEAGVMIGANIALTYATGGAFTLLRSIVMGARGINVIHNLFDSTKSMAKLTGKLFGCSLAIGFPFYS